MPWPLCPTSSGRPSRTTTSPACPTPRSPPSSAAPPRPHAAPPPTASPPCAAPTEEARNDPDARRGPPRPRPPDRPAGAGRRRRRAARRRLDHRGDPRRASAAGRDAAGAGARRLRDRGPRRRLADPRRPDQPTGAARPGPPLRRRPAARGVLRRPTHRLRAAAGPAAGGRLPPRRPHPAAPGRLRHDRQLRHRRGRRGQSPGRPRGRDGVRDQPAAGRRPLPPGGAQRRRARQLRGRGRGQAHAADPGGGGVRDRVDGLDWAALTEEIDAAGSAQTPPVLTPDECREIAALYDDVGRFRSTIDMARYRFGSGHYRYFDHPLPDVVAELRAAFYPHLLSTAQEWASRLRRPALWPDTLDEWLAVPGSRRGRDRLRNRPGRRGGPPWRPARLSR